MSKREWDVNLRGQQHRICLLHSQLTDKPTKVFVDDVQVFENKFEGNEQYAVDIPLRIAECDVTVQVRTGALGCYYGISSDGCQLHPNNAPLEPVDLNRAKIGRFAVTTYLIAVSPFLFVIGKLGWTIAGLIPLDWLSYFTLSLGAYFAVRLYWSRWRTDSLD